MNRREAMRARWGVARPLLPARPDIHRWVWLTARYYAITVEQLRQRCRTREAAERRWVAMALLHEDTEYSYHAIAGQVGLHDHSTVKHGIQQVAATVRLQQIVAAVRALDEMPAKRTVRPRGRLLTLVGKGAGA